MMYRSPLFTILENRATAQHTPDILEIRGQQHLVFVFDDFRQGGQFHSVLEHCEYLGEYHTLEARFNPAEIRTELGNLPVARPLSKIEPWGNHLKGEVYLVSHVELLKMDEVLENDGPVKRRLVTIAADSLGESDFKAWVYLFDDEFPPDHVGVVSVLTPTTWVTPNFNKAKTTSRVSKFSPPNPMAPAAPRFSDWDDMWDRDFPTH